jgi:hypothetical protein
VRSKRIVHDRNDRHDRSAPPPAANSDKTTSTKKIAIVAGVFFLITDITAFGGELFYNPVLSTTGA